MSSAEDPVVSQLQSLLSSRSDLVAAYLFGSVGRGTSSPNSDIDLALLYVTPPEPTLDAQPYSLAGDLTAALGRSVDLVVMNTAPPDLVHRILRDGILLFDNDPSRRVAFEVRLRNEYFDLLPILQEYRRHVS